MNKNIEQLQAESNEIRASLEKLQNETQNSEKEKQTQQLLEKAKKGKKEAESLLNAENDSKKRAVIEKCKADFDKLLKEVNTISTNGKASLNTSSAQESQTTVKESQTTQTDTTETSNTNTKNQKEEKTRFESTKDYTKKQWEHVWSKESRKNETWKNLARTAGFIGTGVWAFMLVKKGWDRLFWSDEKTEEKTDSSTEKKEKKWFWDKWYGKTLKFLGIGAAGAGAVWGIGKLFGLWEKEWATGNDTDNDKYNNYENFINTPENKEKAENYESFGNNIDTTYQTLYNQELKAGYQDELEMERISKALNKEKKYKWIVPFCLDNQYGSVEEILYQNTNFKNIISWGLHQMKTYIENLAADQLQVFVDSYLSKLPSRWILNWFTGSLKEKINKWVLENQQSKEELQYFFRQGIRVQTYLFEKRDQLKQKIIEKTAQSWWVSPQDILKDEEKLNAALNANSDYNLFLHSPISDAIKILQRNQLFDDKVGAHVQEAVKELDKQRNEILNTQTGEKDILQVINEKTDENLSENEKNQLISSCDNIIKDVDENITEAVEASMWNIYGNLFASGDSFIREYFSKAGMENAFNTIKQVIRGKQTELKNWNLTLEKAKALASTINNLLAMKKEIILGANTLEREEDENGNLLYRIPGFATGSWSNFLKGFSQLVGWDWIMDRLEGVWGMFSWLLGVWITISVVWGIVTWIAFGWKAGAKFALRGMKLTLAPAYLPAKWAWALGKRFRPIQRLGDKLVYWAPNNILWWMKFRGEKGPEKLIEDMKLGYISLKDASDILRRKTTGNFWSKKILEARKLKFKILGEKAKDIKYSERVFDVFLSSTKMGDSYLQNLKTDRTLYEKVIENFDRSPKIMEAIRWDQPLEQLKKIVDEVETNHKKVINTARQAASEIAESILESNSYKALNLEFDNTLKILNYDLASASEGKKLQIQKQIEHLENIKQNFAINKTQVEIDQLFNFYKEYNKLAPNKSIANLDTLGKMLSKNLPDLEKALKELDLTTLKQLKSAGNFDDVSDEAFKSVVTMINEIKEKKMHGVNIFKNSDEMLDGIKAFVKILSKST